MIAIFVSSIPVGAKDPISPKLRESIDPIVHPYLMLTSQWQLWNIFSPDPLRQVSEYSIQVRENQMWADAQIFNETTVPAHRHADTFKMLGRIEEQPELWSRYLRLKCDELQIEHGKPIRIQKRFYVLPHDDAASIPGGWGGWSPDWDETSLEEIHCP